MPRSFTYATVTNIKPSQRDETISKPCHGGAAQLICDYKGELTSAPGMMRPKQGQKFYLSGPSLAEAGLSGCSTAQLEERLAGRLSSGSGNITLMDCSS